MKKRPLFLLSLLGASLSLYAIPMEEEGSQDNRLPNSRTTATRGTDAREGTGSDLSAESTRRGTTVAVATDDVEEDARNNIQLGLTVDVASQALQNHLDAEKAYKTALTAQGSSGPFVSEGTFFPSEEDLSQEIKTHLKGQFLAELALETLQGAQAAADRLATVYSGLPELKKTSSQIAMSVAEETLGAATRADLEARTVREQSSERNFEHERVAYKRAAEAWDKTLIAYADLKTSFQDSPAIMTPLEDYLRNADVRATLWQAHFPWVSARHIEAEIEGPLTIEKAEQAEAAWGEVVEAYGEALTKAERAALNEVVLGLQADFESAQAREATWSNKIDELTKKIAVINPEQLARTHLYRLERDKLRTNRAAREAVWSEQNQRFYEKWPLLGDIAGVTTTSESQERASETRIPPLQLTSELEELGRKLLRAEKRAETSTSISSTAAIEEQPALKAAASNLISTRMLPPGELEEQALSDIMTASQPSTPDNKYRWALRETADRLFAEAGIVAQEKLAQVDNAKEATETDEKSTILGSVTRSVIGWRPKHLSVVGSTISKSSFSSKSSKTKTESLIDPYEAATAAEEEWKSLVNQAEGIRVQSGGTPLEDPFLVIDTWAKADKKALAAKKEREKFEKEKATAVQHQENWESNTARWKARALAEQRDREAKVLEQKATELENEKRVISAQVSAKIKQQAVIAAAEAAAEATAARTVATEAEAAWSRLASQNPRVTEALTQGNQAAAEEAVVKLKSSDQAVYDLWIETSNLYADDEFKEPESPAVKQAREEQEAQAYKTNLLIQRTSDIATYFADVDTTLLAAKKEYTKATRNKDAVKYLYDAIDRSEMAAWDAYTQTAKNSALQAARKKISGAAEAWAYRMALSEKERVNQEQLSAKKPPAADAWADDNQRSLARATVIAGADEGAFKIFQREETRLADINTLWVAIIEAKKRAAREEREHAAKEYAQGNKSSWLALSSEEQGIYNREIAQANKAYETAATEKIENAEAVLILARRRANNTWNMFFSAASAHAIRKAETALSKVAAAEEDRQKTIHWAKLAELTPSERKTEWLKIKRDQENKRENNRWMKLTFQEKKAQAAQFIAQLRKGVSECYAKRDRSIAIRKGDKGEIWNNIGARLYDTVEKLEKVIKAEAIENPAEILNWGHTVLEEWSVDRIMNHLEDLDETLQTIDRIKGVYESTLRRYKWQVQQSNSYLDESLKTYHCYPENFSKEMRGIKNFVKPLSKNPVVAAMQANLFDGILVRYVGVFILGGAVNLQERFDFTCVGGIRENREYSCRLYEQVKLLSSHQEDRTTLILAKEQLAVEIEWAAQVRKEAYDWLQDDRWKKANRDEIEEIVKFLSIGLDTYEEQNISKQVREKWISFLSK